MTVLPLSFLFLLSLILDGQRGPLVWDEIDFWIWDASGIGMKVVLDQTVWLLKPSDLNPPPKVGHPPLPPGRARVRPFPI